LDDFFDGCGSASLEQDNISGSGVRANPFGGGSVIRQVRSLSAGGDFLRVFPDSDQADSL
jgi:hypothetical protein